MSNTAAVASLSDSSSISSVMDALVNALGLSGVRNIGARKEAWVTSLEDHMILTLGSLRRVSPQRIGKLALPLLIEDELEKIIVNYAARDPLLSVQGVPRLLTDGNGGTNDKVAPGASGGKGLGAGSRVRVTNAKGGNSGALDSANVKPNPLLAITARQRELLKGSWNALLTMKDFDNAQNDGLYQLARSFYPLFLKSNYTARRLFAEHDLAKQGSALVRMLAFIVKSLDDPESVTKPMRELGGRHAVYGVERGDFVQFSKSMVETVLQILGPERFDTETQRAWSDALAAMTELILDSGAVARNGFHGVLLRESGGASSSGTSSSAWKKVYAHLTLDTLFLYADPKHKKLKGRFPMAHVDDISFPNAAVPNAFQLTCPVTPFTLLVAAESKAALDEFCEEITWRLAALNRVYSESVESDTDASGSGQESSGAVAHKAAMTKAKKTAKQLQKRKGQNAAATAQTDSTGPLKLNISDEQGRALKASWEALVNLKDPGQDPAVNGLNKFVDLFYPNFFAMNPTSVKLFKGTSMKVQGRALIKMIAIILRGIDDPKSVQDTLVSLGGRHEIYGVEAFDYQQFAICLADTLEAVLGKKIVTDSVRDAWFKTIVALSQVMLISGRLMAQHQFRSPLLRLKGNGKWKRAVTGLSLTTLNLFDDDEGVKLKTAHDLRHLLDVVVEEDVAAPTEFVFSVTLTEAPYKVTMAAETEDLFLKWVEELNWRMAAVQRVFVEEDDSGSESASASASAAASKGGKSSEGKSKAKKVLGKTKHRRQKKDESRLQNSASRSGSSKARSSTVTAPSLSASQEEDSDA